MHGGSRRMGAAMVATPLIISARRRGLAVAGQWMGESAGQSIGPGVSEFHSLGAGSLYPTIPANSCIISARKAWAFW
jgi:hypothetical protein